MKSTFLVMLATIVFGACVKPYEPGVIRANTNYLVVEGVLNADSNTTIRLSRTRNLSDTGGAIPELNARLSIESAAGVQYSFQPAGDGTYTSENAFLDATDKYRLRINTFAGSEYLSDFLPVKLTPEIDSLHWEQRDDIFIYVNTHDPSGDARYYRWDFIETSEYHAEYESYLDYRDGAIVFLEPDQYRQVCYKSDSSTDLLIGSSAALSEDVINRQLIRKIPNDNSKVSVRYSILVRQYAVTPEAYQFWQILRQNSEQTGGLFDPLPSQLKSNIHCTSDPGEPVMGYLSACSVKSKRIFIRWAELANRQDPGMGMQCKPIFIDLYNDLEKYLGSGAELPAYLVSSTGPVAIAPNICVDCRVRGGITQKPSFW